MTATDLQHRSGKTATDPAATVDLRSTQLIWLAAAVFIVAAGYGTLLPLLPGWLAPILHGAPASDVGRHVGFVNGVYAVGIFVGAPLWGLVSDRVGRRQILIIGLVGYVGSLLALLVPAFGGLWAIYSLRGMTGFFSAAVVPVVSALIADHTPEEKRARRFAWLGAMSLLGVLVGPGLIDIVHWLGSLIGQGAMRPDGPASIVIVLSALFGFVMMLGLAWTLPHSHDSATSPKSAAKPAKKDRTSALWWMSAAVMSVLAGFEVIMVLQGQQASGRAARQVALMLAVCMLVMLAISAMLFLTALLEKVSARILMGGGLVLAMAGLTVLAASRTESSMYWGLSLTAAGIGLVLPVISYLSAGVSREKLGITMGSLAAAVAMGQAVGSSVGGWLFGAVAQSSYLFLLLPLMAMLVLLLVRPGLWSGGDVAGSLCKHRSNSYRD